MLLSSMTACGLAGGLTAHALELRVTGRIVPDACLTFFSNNGVVDYGPLSAGENDTTKILNKQSLSLFVSCPTPSRVAIRLFDNRNVAAIPVMKAVAARYRNNAYLFGMGPRTGKNAGGYTISFKPLLVHGSPVLLESEGKVNDIQWSIADDNMLRKDVFYSWQAIHKTYPGGSQNFQASFAIQPVLEGKGPQAVQSDTEGAQIYGSATFELFYL